MPKVIINRTFSLKPVEMESHHLDLSTVIEIHKKLVNILITHGSLFPEHSFEDDSLITIKRFYTEISNIPEVKKQLKQFDTKERLARSAAEYAYIHLQHHFRTMELITQIGGFVKGGELSEVFGYSYKEHSKQSFPYTILNKLQSYLRPNELATSSVHLANTCRQLRNILFDHVEFGIPITETLSHKVKAGLIGKYTTSFIQDLYIQFIRSHPKGIFEDRVIPSLDTNSLDLEGKIESTINSLGSYNSKQLVRYLLYPEEERKFQYIRRTKEFGEYIDRHIITSVEQILVEHLKNVMSEELEDLLDKAIQNPEDYMKIPEFTGSSISFSIDDSSLYSIDYDNHLNSPPVVTLSFYPHQFYKYELRTPQRFYSVIIEEFIPKRGTITCKRGKILLSIPFMKFAEKPARTNNRILGVDLGVKTFATLSMCEDGEEIDRKFLDQRELLGKKNRWFLGRKTHKFVNFKGRLIFFQKRTRKLQSKIAKEQDPDRKEWLEQEFRRVWTKISNIHRELVRQIATRVISYAKYHKCTVVRLEDLSWANPGRKYRVGYYLTTWQVHWFHGQIRELIVDMGRREEIKVEVVTARYSSKLCSRCEVRGKRNGKIFRCGECGFQLDSDLNAARNLAKPDWTEISNAGGTKLVHQQTLEDWF